MEWLNSMGWGWGIPLGLVGGAALIGLFEIPKEIMWRRRMKKREAQTLAQFDLDMLNTQCLWNLNPSKKEQIKFLSDLRQARQDIFDEYRRKVS